jgi:hypothetical protein
MLNQQKEAKIHINGNKADYPKQCTTCNLLAFTRLYVTSYYF